LRALWGRFCDIGDFGAVGSVHIGFHGGILCMLAPDGLYLTSPSPRLRGEGRGEGDPPRVGMRMVPLTRIASPMRSDLSPQAGRGDSNSQLVHRQSRSCRVKPLIPRPHAGRATSCLRGGFG
jgi:hypothetical protein